MESNVHMTRQKLFTYMVSNILLKEFYIHTLHCYAATLHGRGRGGMCVGGGGVAGSSMSSLGMILISRGAQ